MRTRYILLPLLLVPWIANAHEIDRIDACKGLSRASERLACYDEVHGYQAEQSMGSVKPNQTRPEVATGQPDPAFGLPPEKPSKTPSITAVVLNVERNRYGKLTLQLDNNQIWRQLDSAKLHIRVSDEVLIRTAALGSHLLEKSSGSRTIRVQRLK